MALCRRFVDDARKEQTSAGPGPRRGRREAPNEAAVGRPLLLVPERRFGTSPRSTASCHVNKRLPRWLPVVNQTVGSWLQVDQALTHNSSSASVLDPTLKGPTLWAYLDSSCCMLQFWEDGRPVDAAVVSLRTHDWKRAAAHFVGSVPPSASFHSSACIVPFSAMS